MYIYYKNIKYTKQKYKIQISKNAKIKIQKYQKYKNTT